MSKSDFDANIVEFINSVKTDKKESITIFVNGPNDFYLTKLDEFKRPIATKISRYHGQ